MNLIITGQRCKEALTIKSAGCMNWLKKGMGCKKKGIYALFPYFSITGSCHKISGKAEFVNNRY
jgi:hypothetical protein